MDKSTHAEHNLNASFYNLAFEFDDLTVLFNSRHGTLCEVSTDLLGAIEHGDLAKIPDELIKELQGCGFLVHSEANEIEEYLREYEATKERGGVLTFMLFLATSCNLGCSYCYQDAPEKPKRVMRKPQLARLLLCVEDQLERGRLSGVDIQFYGGEPLLARSNIPWFIESLNAICDHHQVPCSYSIVTNGTLLSEELIKLFVDNRVRMQITLDGGQETHDRRRYWKGKKRGTYERIIGSLESIVRHGGADLIQLRMNVDQDNLNDVASVAELANSLGIADFDCGLIHFREKIVGYSEKMIPSEHAQSWMASKVFSILKNWGFSDTPVDLEPKTTCMYHWKQSFAVSPDLDLFKCDELIDFPEYRVGTITADGDLVLNDAEYKKAVSRTPTDFEDCQSCRFLPQCGSGCSIRALNVKGTPHANYCEASYDSTKRKVLEYCRVELGIEIENDEMDFQMPRRTSIESIPIVVE